MSMCVFREIYVYLHFVYNTIIMRKLLLTLLAMSILIGASAQNKKCGIDTKALVAEEIASGATQIKMLAKMAPGFDRSALEKAGMVIGSQVGQIVTLRVPIEALPLLESNKEVLQYSISHSIAAPDCNLMRFDTRTDSVHKGLGLDLPNTSFDGEGVYIGITDWGFDYTHPNYNYGEGNYRVEMAWDHFRLSGPAPEGFDYGTLITGRDHLLAAKGDTSNIYGYGSHGTHVAGISAGRGNNGNYMGQAPNARLLLCSFGLNESDWIDAVSWMHKVAQDSSRRLVVNSSWGMYSFNTIDGTSLLSQAIDSLSDKGVVFVTSGGNNGRSSIPFHISHTFTADSADTVRTIAERASNIYSITEIGQVLILWGEEGHDFSAGLRLWKNSSNNAMGPMYSTAIGDTLIYDTLRCNGQTASYRILIEHSNPFDNRPHIQINVSKVLMETQLFITADSGTVHAWNLADKENHAGNEGCSFLKGTHADFTNGDNRYGVGEPACAAKCISVAAHKADQPRANGSWNPGKLAAFSSVGPLINGVMKPEISAPGVDVISSISHWTDGSYTPSMSITIDDTMTYIWSKMSGTSMSCPSVTGIVALLLQANPRISVDQIRHCIFTTARNDTLTGPLVARDSMDYRWGWGKIDALRAINKAISLVGINQVEELRTPLKVFPNPATSTVQVMTLCGESQLLKVYSVDGRLVMQTPVVQETTLDVSGWQRGVYILRVGSRTEKLIVR